MNGSDQKKPLPRHCAACGAGLTPYVDAEARAGDDVDEVLLVEPHPGLIPEGVPARRLLAQFLARRRELAEGG